MVNNLQEVFSIISPDITAAHQVEGITAFAFDLRSPLQTHRHEQGSQLTAHFLGQPFKAPTRCLDQVVNATPILLRYLDRFE